MKLFTKFSLFIIFFISSSHAFLNIEALRQSKSDEGVSGSTRLNMNQQKGNVDKIVFGFTTLNQYQRKEHSFLLMAAYQYGESFSEVDNREGHLHFRYTWSFSKRLELEAFQQSEFNRFQDLDSRILLGGGIRSLIFRGSTMSLFLGTGAFYEKESLKAQKNLENPRGNIYLSFLKEVVKDYSISSTLYYQPNIENFSDNRFRFSLGLESNFAENFTQSFEYNIRRDSLPPVGIQKTDSSISAGLGYKY